MVQQYIAAAALLRQELVGWRRTLHTQPEVGKNLPNTVSYVARQLKQMGYEPRNCGGGLYALAGNPDGGATILLRADMDALPMREESGEPFASTNGCAHTCGHDLHTAMLLGAARLLKDAELPGAVKLMFQPDEEGLTGARAMVMAGVLEEPRVDAAVALHVMPGLEPVGAIVSGAGAMAASSDIFRISVTGQGGHGAAPHQTTDVLGAAIGICTALRALRGQEIDPLHPCVLTIGSLQAGAAPNVLPQQAALEGSLRAFEQEDRKRIWIRMREIAEQTATAHQCAAELIWLGQTPPVVNDPQLTGQLHRILGPYAPSLLQATPVMGSEDFAEVASRIPSTYFMVAAGGQDPSYRAGRQHSPNVRFNEDVLPYGAAYLAGFAHQWLKEQSSRGGEENV